MSQNVETAKRFVDAFNRSDVETMLHLATPEPVMSSQLLDAGAEFRGREGAERFYAMLNESWDEFRTVAEEYRDFGDRVLMLGHNTARGRGSGVPVSGPTATIIDFDDGHVSRVRLYLDHDEALRAAGLSE